MPLLDFKEIAAAHIGENRDSFELLAREVLESLGYKVLEGPDRGPDGGRDLLVEEVRTGIGGSTSVRWLVSCKHLAHSGRAVGVDDEQNIVDRLAQHRCAGFIGFYSTIPSSGLGARIGTLMAEHQVFDHERIERYLLSGSAGRRVAERFFPESLAKLNARTGGPASLFGDAPDLRCACCKRSLLRPEPSGIVCVWRVRTEDPRSRGRVERVYWCCKGDCDSTLAAVVARESPGLDDGWEDLPDIASPVYWLKWAMSLVNQLHDGCVFDREAFDAFKELLVNLYPHVARQMTDEEEETLRHMAPLPGFLGGFS